MPPVFSAAPFEAGESAATRAAVGGWIWHATCDTGGTSVDRRPMSESWYLVSNTRTGQYCDVVAGSAETACRSRGWRAVECVVIRVAELGPPGSHHQPTDPAPESGARFHQYAEKSR